MDSALSALAARSGEPVSPEETIDLMAGAKAIFLTATLECRNFDFVKEHRELWEEALGVFREAWKAWEGISKSDAHIEALRRQLGRLVELTEDRVLLYASAEAWERKARALRKADLGFSSFTER